MSAPATAKDRIYIFKKNDVMEEKECSGVIQLYWDGGTNSHV